jgi:hypothetical protein
MRLVASQSEPASIDTPSLDVASLSFAQIERLVGDLAMAVKRGDVVVDDIFEIAFRLSRINCCHWFPGGRR